MPRIELGPSECKANALTLSYSPMPMGDHLLLWSGADAAEFIISILPPFHWLPVRFNFKWHETAALYTFIQESVPLNTTGLSGTNNWWPWAAQYLLVGSVLPLDVRPGIARDVMTLHMMPRCDAVMHDAWTQHCCMQRPVATLLCEPVMWQLFLLLLLQRGSSPQSVVAAGGRGAR